MTHRRLIRRAALLVAGTLLAGCTSSAWQPLTMSRDECVRRAKLAMRDSDFTERLDVALSGDEAVVSGRHGGYWAELHCAADGRGVRLDVKGFDPTQVERYKDSITRRWL